MASKTTNKGKRLQRNFRYEGKTYSVYGYSESELDKKQTQKEEALKRGEVIVESGMTVNAWAEQFLEVYKSNSMRGYVYDNYKWSLEHYVLESLGKSKLKDVKPIMCQRVLNQLDGKSASLIHKTHIQMREMFQKAVDNRLISSNPASGVIPPQGTKNKRRSLTASEETAFLAAAKKHQHGLLFMFMWGCGCRPSEAAEIRGRDIITKDGKLILHIRGTKTKASDRYVPIPAEVAEMLPDNPEPFLPVVMTKEGNKISPRRQRGAWDHMEYLMNIELGCETYRNQLIPPYPLAGDLCSYCLRHTYCTNLQRRGVDIRQAQYLMGHSSIRMTADVYSHTGQDDVLKNYDLITGNVTNEEEKKDEKKNEEIMRVV